MDTTTSATFGNACAGSSLAARLPIFGIATREDIELARGLGCTVFRLSLSWARLEPEPGVWSDEAFAQYRDVLQAIRDAGMSAMVTLVHNTWPFHVQAAGQGAGPLDPSFPDSVTRFATEVAQRLGDLIDDYVTLNEPDQLVYGWIKGFWMRAYAMPPGQPPYATGDEQMDDMLTLIPNLFRAHAKAREAIRPHPAKRACRHKSARVRPAAMAATFDRSQRHALSRRRMQSVRRARIATSAIAEGGRVDCSIAQLTMTLERGEHAFFSEPYYCTPLAALHASTLALPADVANVARADRRGRRNASGRASSAAGSAPQRFRMSTRCPTPSSALRRGEVDAVFDDEVTLRAVRRRRAWPHAASGAPSNISPSRWRSGAARCSTSRIAPSASCGASIPRFQTLSTAKRSRTSGAKKKRRRYEQPVPDMDRSIARIRKRGVLRVGIHPGVPGLCIESPFDRLRVTRAGSG